MFPLWSTLLGGSFVFKNMGPSSLFFVFPFCWYFGYFMMQVFINNLSKM
jgi:hypothetical protein